MAGVKLNLKFDDRQLSTQLNQMVSELSNPKALHQDIGEYLQLSTAERWDKEQAPDGSSWEGLKESTKERKTKNKNSILRENDFLRDTLAYFADDDGVEFGSNRVQAALMQWGGSDDMAPGPAAVPSRQFLGLSNEDEDEIIQLTEGFMMAAVRP
ncbi:phage virion morphogenesis protein [Pseudoalteromonas luteoviolacea]|uniref:phage virion morphogenesis protein n=1 Tax=Pseudoalteromonas luteoviolacea TaxID=43657 RepID=UPI00114E35D7|nr:phage virion morphogenesis protein [Pseudoalteromonas luteoviolacea]TQF69559.1 phage virion morphogenesis protein [Pseudoalteromonas luteoviolacea]